MSLYIDSSCFIKVLLTEPETPRLLKLLEWETEVIVSELTRLEAFIQFQRRYFIQEITYIEFKNSQELLANFIRTAPFHYKKVSQNLLDKAVNQVLRARLFCKTLDRLHLAIMEEMGLERLLTNDIKQAKAAQELGFSVTILGHEK